MSKLTTIEGIGPAMSSKLKEGGIRSINALLEAGATPGGRKEVSTHCGIPAGQILKFVNHADLMRIKGVGGEYAELLEAAGVDSVPELAMRNPTNLAARMMDENAKRKLVRLVPSAATVAKWVDQAKRMERVVRH